MTIHALEKLVTTYAFSLPETTEDHPWGETVAKVRGKVFVFMGKPQDEPKKFGFSVKLPHSAIAVLEAPNAEPTGYGLGRHGWVSITFSDGDAVDEGWVKSLILESWRAVAPKKLVAAHKA
jgi:predicted DNA-binding protein (MmcQ/YjbR family)